MGLYIVVMELEGSLLLMTLLIQGHDYGNQNCYCVVTNTNNSFNLFIRLDGIFIQNRKIFSLTL